MGHERVGVLPRTREWRAPVRQIAATAEALETVRTVASSTLLKVRQGSTVFQRTPAFRLLSDLSSALPTAPPPAGTVDLSPRRDLESNPSALRLTAQMRAWVDDRSDSYFLTSPSRLLRLAFMNAKSDSSGTHRRVARWLASAQSEGHLDHRTYVLG